MVSWNIYYTFAELLRYKNTSESHQDRTVRVLAEACKVDCKCLLSCTILSTILIFIFTVQFHLFHLCHWSPLHLNTARIFPSLAVLCPYNNLPRLLVLLTYLGFILLKLPPLQNWPFLSAYSGSLASAGIPTWVSLLGTRVMNVEWTLVAVLTSRKVQTICHVHPRSTPFEAQMLLILQQSFGLTVPFSSVTTEWKFRCNQQ
jgi:hypothetical protein